MKRKYLGYMNSKTPVYTRTLNADEYTETQRSKRNEMIQINLSHQKKYTNHTQVLIKLTPISVQEIHSQHNIYSQVASATSPTDLGDLNIPNRR